MKSMLMEELTNGIGTSLTCEAPQQGRREDQVGQAEGQFPVI